MRYPQLVVLADHDRLEAEFRPLASERRWLLRPVHQVGAAFTAVREVRPTVLVLECDPTDESCAALELLLDVRRSRPDVPAIVVSRVKLSEPDRSHWTAGVLDLGAAFVLFPPLDRTVLDDLVTSTMASALAVEEPDGGPAS